MSDMDPHVMPMNRFFSPAFIQLMSNIEVSYKNNLPITLDPKDAFILDTTVEMLLDILRQSTQLFNHLQKLGIIHIEAETTQ